DFLTGIRVASEQPADHAELITGRAVDQQNFSGFLILNDGRSAGHGVTHFVVSELFAPDHFAGVLVQRHHAGIEGAEENLVAIDGGATVDHVTAGTDVVRQAMGVVPQLLAGAGVDGEYAGIGAGDVDHAVVDQRLGFLSALLLITKRKGPRRCQHGDVVGVDVVECAVALSLDAQAVHQDVVGGGGIIGDVSPAYRLGSGMRGATSSDRGGPDHGG